MLRLAARLRALLSLLFVVLLLSPEAACAVPAPSTATILAGSSIGSIAANKRRGTVFTPPPTSVAYDTSIGASVDANGFADVSALHAGAHRYFVNSATGNDANGCTAAQSAATPLATPNTAIGCIVADAHAGDQVLFAEGTTYAGWLYNGYVDHRGGFSAQFPTVLSSYDPADPTNTAKYGRGDQRNARPLFTADMHASVNGGILSNAPFSYFAIKGLAFDPGNIEDEGIGFIGDGTGNTGGPSYLLVENNLFHHAQLSIDAATAVGQPFATSHIVIRNNDFDGAFDHSSTGRVGGIYTGGGINGITIEDNVIYHVGWKEGDADRSGTPLWGTQSHPAYIQTDTAGVAYRRNLVIEPSADGGILRGSGSMSENVLIHVAAGLGIGPDGSHWADFPTGVDIDTSYNLEIASIATGQPGGAAGYAFSSAKGNPGTRIHHNLIVQSENSAGTPSVFSNITAGAGHTSYMEHENNLSFAWATAGHSIFTDTGTFSSSTLPYTTYDNNSWEDASSGSNVSNSGATFPNAYTLSTLLAAAGYADLPTLEAYVIGHPEAHVQRTMRTLAFAGYGRNAAPVDTTAPTLSSPTASSPSAGNATLGVTTNDATGKLYYELLTTGTAPHVSRIKVGVDSSDAAAPKAGSLAVTSAGTKSVSLSGVPPGTYFAHFMHEDAEANKSAAVTSSSFVVASASATWNSANSSADWTLSNGNLTANRTSTGAGFWAILRGTTAKTSGTIIVRVDAIGGGVFTSIGFDTGAETQYPGQEGSGGSIGYQNTGAINAGGGTVATVASYTDGDCIKETRSGSSFSFYKQTACTGSFVLQTTFDTGPPGEAIASVAAYPAASNGNGTGTQLTLDASGW